LQRWKAPVTGTDVHGFPLTHIEALLFLEDSKTLVTCGNTDIRLWDTQRKKQVKVIAARVAPAQSIAYLPQKNLLAVGHTFGDITLWPLVTDNSALYYWR
jgi:WD40 repeat protein